MISLLPPCFSAPIILFSVKTLKCIGVQKHTRVDVQRVGQEYTGAMLTKQNGITYSAVTDLTAESEFKSIDMIRSHMLQSDKMSLKRKG